MSEFLAEASVLIRPDTTKFRATLVAELAAATRGIVVPVSVAAAGGKAAVGGTQQLVAVQEELAAATTTANVATTKQVSVQRIAAATAAAEAKAQRAAARAAAESAATHEQLARGAGATVLSEAGLRGATLAASSSFLVGAAAVTILAKSVREANAENEAAARATKVFGEAAAQLRHDAEGFAETLGISTTETLRFEGAIGNVLTVAGIAHDRIPQLSEDLVKLGANMAAFNNVPLEQTLKAIQLGLVGNSRGLRQFGVELNAAAVNAEALRESGKQNTAELTREERVQARINLLFRQTTLQQKGAEDRMHSLAGETRTLKANLANMSAELGNVVSPVIKAFVIDLNTLFLGLHKANQGLGELGGGLGSLAERLVEALPGGNHLRDAIVGFDDAVRGSQGSTDGLSESLRRQQDIARENATVYDLLTGKVLGTAHSMEEFEGLVNRLQFKDAEKSLSSLGEHLLDLQFTKAPQGAVIANLRRQIEAAQTEIATAPTVKARVTAREKRNALQDQIDSILAQQKADAQDTADKATSIVEQINSIVKAAAEKAKQLRDESDQAFVSLLGADQAKQNLAQIRAEGTKSLVDDVAAQKELQSLLRREIAEAKVTILDAQLRAQTILDLTTKLLTANNALKALEGQQAANRQQRRQASFDRAAESVDLDIQLAQTQKNLRAEIAARQRRIALDVAREKAVKGDTLAAKRLRNDIAEQRAAIKDLQKQLGDRNKDFQALEFEFLQTQAGFAATLISNLIPTSAVAGTVGGGAITTPTPSQANPQRPPDVGAGLGAAAQGSGGPRGATTGQMSMLIEINRNMLRVLSKLAGEQTHPEARVQKIAQAASMDIINW